MILPFLLSLAFSVGLCVHAVRTHQDTFWLWVILLFQPIGGIVYVAAVLAPSLIGGPTARRAASAAREKLDPGRAYRQAAQAMDDAPTVANRARLAGAAAGLGKWDEAERLYTDAAQGVHADDPMLLQGRAQALVELGRNAEALPLLEQLGQMGEGARTADAALLMGRAYEALGRNSEAERAYNWAAGRLAGLEGLARYAAFLAHTGQREQSREVFADLEHRAAKTRGQFRAEAAQWRDFAARAMAAGA